MQITTPKAMYAAAPQVAGRRSQVAADAEPPQVSSSHPVLHSYEGTGGNLACPLHRRGFLIQWEKLRASGFPKPTVFHIVW